MNRKQPVWDLLLKVLLIATIGYYFNQTIEVFSKEEKASGKVFEKGGCIYLSQESKADIKLTNSGKDRTPVVSPDGKKIVFIRKSEKNAYNPIEGVDSPRNDPLADQVWIIGRVSPNFSHQIL